MQTATSAHVCTPGRVPILGELWADEAAELAALQVSINTDDHTKLDIQIQPKPWRPARAVPAAFRLGAELLGIEAVILTSGIRFNIRDGIVYRREPYTCNLTIDFERTAELARLRVRQVATRMACEALEAQRIAFEAARDRLLDNAFGPYPEVPAC